MVFVFAFTEFFHLFAGGVDSQLLRFHGKSQFMRNLIFQFIELVALELHNFVAIIANDVVVVRVIGIVGVVNLVVLAEVHFVHEAAFGK